MELLTTAGPMTDDTIRVLVDVTETVPIKKKKSRSVRQKQKARERAAAYQAIAKQETSDRLARRVEKQD